MANRVKDITGEKFGKLTVLKRDGYTNGKRKSILWLCKCDCGNEVLRTSAHLKQNYNSTCGKCNLINDLEYIGKKFGYWTIIEPAKGKDRKKSYLCECKCGTRKVVHLDTMKLGKSKSCGCFHKEKLIEDKTTHGKTGQRIARIYYNMMSRCYDEKNKRFSDYGGRGVRVCDEWRNNSCAFIEWATQNGYSDDLSIDRIDNNGDYSPNNCRFITTKEQSNNRRNSILLTFFGNTKTMKEWCDCIGEDYNKIYARYYRGYKAFREKEISKIKKYVENGGK